MMIRLTQRQKRVLLHLSILKSASVTDIIKEEIREFQTIRLIETTKRLNDLRELELHWKNLVRIYWRDLQKLKEYGLVEKVPHSRKYRLTNQGKNLVKQFHSHPLLLLKSKIEKEGDEGVV